MCSSGDCTAFKKRLFLGRLGGNASTRTDILENCLSHFDGGRSKPGKSHDRIETPHEHAGKTGKNKLGSSESAWQACNQTSTVQIRVLFSHRLHGASSCGVHPVHENSPTGPACLSQAEDDLGAAAVEDWSHMATNKLGPFSGNQDPCFRVSRLSPFAVRVEVGPEHFQVHIMAVTYFGLLKEDASVKQELRDRQKTCIKWCLTARQATKAR